MDEREFLDTMYAGWAKTTGDDHSYWMYEPMVGNPQRNKIYAVSVDPETESETKKLVASFVGDEDAAFITAIAGALPDIYRRCLEAFDEADRLDSDRDEREGAIADLVRENEALKAQIDRSSEEAANWEALWRSNTETASVALRERDEALALNDEYESRITQYENDIDKLDQDYLSVKIELEHWKEQAGGQL